MTQSLRRTATLTAVLLLAAPLCFGAATKKTAPATPAAPSPSQSLGLQVGESLHRAGVTDEVDVDAFVRGLKDGLAGKAVAAEDTERVNTFITDIRRHIVDRNHAAAREFLTKNASAPGVVTTASGLQYRIVEPGDASASSPAPTDRVTVHYRGKLLDGTEFDSSYSRGAPAVFPVNGVIKGWQEALGLMKPGAKWQLFIPPELAYDANSRPPIPPGSLLLFDVELVAVGAPKETKE